MTTIVNISKQRKQRHSFTACPTCNPAMPSPPREPSWGGQVIPQPSRLPHPSARESGPQFYCAYCEPRHDKHNNSRGSQQQASQVTTTSVSGRQQGGAPRPMPLRRWCWFEPCLGSRLFRVPNYSVKGNRLRSLTPTIGSKVLPCLNLGPGCWLRRGVLELRESATGRARASSERIVWTGERRKRADSPYSDRL